MDLRATVTFANTTKEIHLANCRTAADIRREVLNKFRIPDSTSSHYILKYVNPITKKESALDEAILRDIQCDQISVTVSFIDNDPDEKQTVCEKNDKQRSNYENFAEKDENKKICSQIKQRPLLTPRRHQQLVEQYGEGVMKNISGDAFRVEFPLEQYSKDELRSLFDQYLIPEAMPTPVKQMIQEKYSALLYSERYETESSTTITKQGRWASKEILMMVNIRSYTENHHLICVIAYSEFELPRRFMIGSIPLQDYESSLRRFCIEASKEE